MAILGILFSLLFCFSNQSQAETEAEIHQPLNLEIGLGLGFSHGEHGLEDSERALFAATFGYHWPEWFLGITTRGAFSTASNTEIEVNQVLERGRLAHRTIEYGLVGRRYLNDGWYGQLSIGFDYNEAIASEKSLAPNPTPYFDRFYLDGTWFQFAVGHEIPNTPWFIRLEYTYTFYYHSQIIGTEAGVNRVIEEHNVFNQPPHEQILTFVVGLANLF